MKTKVVLNFVPEASNQPITHNLIAKHHLVVNILRAEIDEFGGKMVLELSGKADDIRKGIDYLKANRVGVRPIKEGVRRDDEICTHCGMIIEFENEKIEQLQRTIAKRNRFLVQNHKLELYGLCAACQQKKRT